MSPLYPLFAALTLALTGLFGYGTYATARLLRHWQPDRNLLLTPAENLLRLALIGGCLLLGRMSGLPDAVLGWQFPQPGQQVLLGLLIGAGLAGSFVVVGWLALGQENTRLYRPLVQFVLPRSPREAVLLPFALLLSVLFEELLFRSLLLGGLSPLLPEAWLVLIFGVVFGLLHSPQGVWGMLGAGLAGVVFSLLFLWQQSLLLPVVAHFVANGVQIWLVAAGVISLPNTDLPNTDLPNTDLPNTDLSNTDLSNTDLSNTDLSNTDLPKTETTDPPQE